MSYSSSPHPPVLFVGPYLLRCIIIPSPVYHYTALQNSVVCSTDSDNGFPTFRDIPYILYCIVIVTLSAYDIIIIQLLNAYQSNDTGNESARSGQVRSFSGPPQPSGGYQW